jgi:hypothetical protein
MYGNLSTRFQKWLYLICPETKAPPPTEQVSLSERIGKPLKVNKPSGVSNL